MDDLVRWLGEQLDEDARIARATLWDDDGALGSGGWYAYDRGPREGFREARWVVIDRADEGVMDSRPQAADDEAVARHVAEWDPARVLREIDAKRQLIARGGPFCTSGCDEPGNEPKNPDTSWTTSLEHHLDCGAYQAAALLAEPYDQRPGYLEKWRP